MLIHYFIFYKRIKIYQPIAITIKNIPYPKNISLRITGITTFDKIYIFVYDQKNCKWEHGYSFIKTIDIELDSTYLNETFELTITVGKERTTYNKDLFIKEWQLINNNNGIQTYKLPEKYSSKSFLGSFFSIFMWEISQKIIFIVFIILILILVIFNIKKILDRISLIKRNKVLLGVLGYGLLTLIILKEFFRLNHDRLEGISFLNALIFIAFWFFILHLISESVFRHFHVNVNKKHKIRLLGISVMISFMCIEFALRIFNVNATYTEKESFKYSSSNYKPPVNYYLTSKDHISTVKKKEFNHTRTFNAEGLPDIEHSVEKGAGVLRVMAIGDSFTEGVGSDFDSTWVSFLSNKMTRQYPLQKFEFFNDGIAGSDPFFEYLLFKDKLLKYKPDVLLLAINTTDVSDFLFRGGFERFLPDSTVQYNHSPEWEGIYAYSYIFRLFIHNLLGYDYHFLKGKDRLIKINEAIAALHDVSLKFYDLCQKNNTTLVLVVHPQLNETIKGSYFYDSFAPTFKNDTRLNVVDVLSFFIKNNINSKETAYKYYWKLDQHHNAKGYNLFADAVFEYIRNKHFVDIKNKLKE